MPPKKRKSLASKIKLTRQYNQKRNTADERKAGSRKRNASEKGRAADRKRKATDEGRAADRKRKATDEGRAAARKRNATEEGRSADRKRKATDEGRAADRKRKATDEGTAAARKRNATEEGRAGGRKRKATARQDPNKRVVDNKDRKRRRETSKIDVYREQIKQGPTYICSCCGGLFFRSSISQYSLVDLREHHLTEEFILNACRLRDVNGNFLLCITCNKYVLLGDLPAVSIANGFDFVDILPELEGMTEIEERLVSPRLPFMQVMKLGCDQQFGLKGNVVNVPIDVDSTVAALPRTFDQMQTVQLKIKRNQQHKSVYLYETVRPAFVFRAAQKLIAQPLYQKHNVTLSNDWINQHVQDTQDFIVESEDQTEAERSENIEMQAEVPAVTNNDAENLESDEVNQNTDATLLLSNMPENVGISIAPGQNSRPLSLIVDEDAEELSFPSIYCGHKRQISSKIRKPSYTQIAKFELRYHDRRACKIPKIFFAFKKSQMLRIRNEISICLRKTKLASGNLTAGQVRDNDFVDGLVKHDDGYRFLRHDRTSPAFWADKEKEVLAMLRQLFCPGLFVTFSAAETRWLELLVMLEKTVNKRDISEADASNLTFKEKARLIQQDPVTCSRYVAYRMRNLLHNVLLAGNGPFAENKICDYYFRDEFQHRGSAHWHGLLWLENCPVFVPGNAESSAACAEFIDRYCCVSVEALKPEFRDLICLQTHKHTFSCKKMVGKEKVCRFGLPLFPMEQTYILEPLNDATDESRKSNANKFKLIRQQLAELERNAELSQRTSFEEFLRNLHLTNEEYVSIIRSQLDRPKIFLKRKPCEIMVNSFNPQLLELHQANMDIQMITDPYDCIKYVLSYLNKSKRGMSQLMREAKEDLSAGNLSIRERLRIISGKFLNATELSAQEAVYHLLSIPVSHCSRGHQFINTGPPEERVRLLKCADDLKKLEADSTDIVAEGLIEHYVDRDQDLESVCLAEYAAFYHNVGSRKNNDTGSDDFSSESSDSEESETEQSDLDEPNVSRKSASKHGKKGKGATAAKRRKKARIIRYRHYNVQQDPYNFYREQLMLFWPWRNEQRDLMRKPDAVYRMFEAEISQNRSEFVRMNAEAIDKAIAEVEANKTLGETEDQQNADEDQNAANDNEFAILYGDEDMVQLDPLEAIGVDTSKPNKVEFFNVPPKLSDEAYEKLVCSLNDKQRRYLMHVVQKLRNNEDMHEFITGSAGVGKSTLIKAVFQTILRILHRSVAVNPEEILVLLAAPTGKASFNIRGMTLHSAFSLPVQQFQGDMPALSADIANKLAAKLSNMRLLIMDEVSMVGARLLHLVNCRLQQIMRSSEPFGGLNVLLLGDFGQLAPVMDKYIFEQCKADAYAIFAGKPLWDLFKIYELTEIMRQKDDVAFATALTNYSNGCLTKDDIALFRSRTLTSLKLKEAPHTINLFQTNVEVNSHNKSVLSKLQSDGCVSEAFDLCTGACDESMRERMLATVASLPTQQTQGLPHSIILKLGARYMITVNIDTSDGLVNGATGRLRRIDYGTLIKTGLPTPTVVWLELDGDDVAGSLARRLLAEHMRAKNIPSEWTPIKPKKLQIKTTKNADSLVLRTQFPLCEAEGITICKSQGSSYESAVVKLTPRLRRSDTYVGMSRVTSAAGLYLNGEFVVPKNNEKSKAQKEAERMKRDVPVRFSLKFVQDMPKSSLKLVFHNVQSLLRHKEYIACDAFYTQADFLLFVETETILTDCLDNVVAGFKCLIRKDCETFERKPFGAAVFCNDNDNRILITDVSDQAAAACMGIYGTLFKYKTITICCLHKLPRTSFTSLVGFLNNMLNELSAEERRKVVIVGDFNIDLLASKQRGDALALNNWMRLYNLRFAMPEECSSTNGNTQIDVCLTNVDECSAGYYENLFSYHKPLWVEIAQLF